MTKMSPFTFYTTDQQKNEIKTLARKLNVSQGDAARTAMRIGLATLKGNTKREILEKAR